jgi:hypothetical protein
MIFDAPAGISRNSTGSWQHSQAPGLKAVMAQMSQ